mmetsp:Transcript_11270/g.26765  ORF Transcript_11270/g.26765 Transcript_11270/m.26765 type:complete len:181 (+) Transcript_11270:298-840(+)|eukprot:CAMPEP_0113462702 /NCGR_PEP_ID=MMETSP0014_2-20120614/12247_1 /TAXON_ID=2857 /ORGANISM="Nitzschia sp." /LENGTH=180 /DNA_ID=CAMNT_0000354611 /DNA_START=298 /DNA_END=840 /DNA_ORIENTATION=+ /assembly_acc=CAM_ASM_000159
MKFLSKAFAIAVALSSAAVQGFAPPSISTNSINRQHLGSKVATTTAWKSPTTQSSNKNNHVAFSKRNSQLFVSIQEQEDYLLDQAAQNIDGPKPDVVYILMYNPNTEQEGVHSTEYPKDSGSEVMVAFESIEDSMNFSMLLKDDPNFPLEPVSTPAPYGQLESACAGMGISIMVVPEQQQ